MYFWIMNKMKGKKDCDKAKKACCKAKADGKKDCDKAKKTCCKDKADAKKDWDKAKADCKKLVRKKPQVQLAHTNVSK